MIAANKRLSVSAVLFGIVAGIIGIAVGLGLGMVMGIALASAFRVSPMEGEAGYFAVTIALLAALLVAPSSILGALYWRGVRKIWLLVGLLVVWLAMVATGAAGFGIWYAMQPHILNLNGPTPLLEFEVKPPDGESIDTLANVEPQLDTDRNSMPGYWRSEYAQNPGVRAGYVEAYFRTSQRLFVLKFPGGEDRIFRLKLPANPMRPKYREWSDWQKPDFVAKSGEQPTRRSKGNDFQIRYRIDYAE